MTERRTETDRERDRRLEDELTEGPTTAIRRAEGHGDEAEEITEGPTPDVRAKEREDERAGRR
jgi:hypothetical protein